MVNTNHENMSSRALTAILLTLTLCAACQSPPDSDNRPPTPEPVTGKSAPLTAFNDACAGQPDFTQPPGCDRIWTCLGERCEGGVCVLHNMDGRSCRVGGGRCSFGTCQEGSCKTECAGCGSQCEAQHLECIASCQDESCFCTCENNRRVCNKGCGLPGPFPEDCPIH
jgi:hypothetical protein